MEGRSGGLVKEKRKKRKRVPAKTQWAERSAEKEELSDLIQLAGWSIVGAKKPRIWFGLNLGDKLNWGEDV
jgi:hypothetical protein